MPTTSRRPPRARTVTEPTELAELRDAACVVLADLSTTELRLLLGRRHAGQVFLPDKWVFPGGRVEPADHALAARFAGDYAPSDLLPEIRPFALAALRELGEETGLIIADNALRGGDVEQCAAPAHLLPLARAITPPGRIRRYDTWFFTATRNAISETTAKPDGELLDLNWFTLAEARNLDLPRITRLVLEDAASRFSGACNALPPAEKLPLYSSDGCGFQRTLIPCRAALCTP